MAARTKKFSLWTFADRFEGDKVVWIILLMLCMISIVCMFSSTSRLVTDKTTRLDMVSEQIFFVAFGLAIIIGLYNIKNINVFRKLSMLGFPLSFVLLLLLDMHVNVEGVVKALNINEAYRILQVGGMQIHVFEVVKVAMVMYLAWAVHAYKSDSFGLANRLSKRYKRLAFLAKPGWKRLVYIYLPIVIVCAGILFGSVSSTLFIGGIMFLTILIGGIPLKDLLLPAVVCIVAGGLCIGLYFVSGGKVFPRVGTAVQRVLLHEERKNIKDLTPGTTEFQKTLDAIRQPESAKIAIHEGGLLGKGPGNSTQKYTVSLMFSDYMYSFIVEEYGLWGGLLIIMLYISLLARGSLIVRYCDSDFAKTAVAGLTILITGQALMHIYINLDMGLLTGQTLPMISHGNSSFLCFCVAFGVILSISKMAKAKIQKETEESEPLMEGMGVDENVTDAMNDLDDFESGRY